MISKAKAAVTRRVETSSFWRAVQVMRDRYRLAPISTLACDLSALRTVTREDLERVLRSDEIDAEWATVGVELAELCAFQDAVAGSVNPGDRRAIYYLIRGFAPARVLEIGTHLGVSTVHIAKAMEAVGRAPTDPTALTTVDLNPVNDPEVGTWRKLGLTKSPRDLIAAISWSDRMRFVTADSLEYLDSCRETFDFIFLDGDHAANTVYQEVPRALRLLAPDGVILLHDYFPGARPLWPRSRIDSGPFLATERLRREEPSIRVEPLGELPWETKLGLRTTSLAVLTRSL